MWYGAHNGNEGVQYWGDRLLCVYVCIYVALAGPYHTHSDSNYGL